MGDVRITATATLVAAVVAVLGSITAVAISAHFQRRLLERQLTDQAAQRRAQWAEERSRTEQAGQVDACVRFDAAVVVAIARLQGAVDLADRPGVRQRLAGRDWARAWQTQLQEALFDMALPYSALRFAANAPLLAAASDVMDALSAMAATAGAVPEPLPPNPLSLLRRSAVRSWRAQVDRARAEVHTARWRLVATVGAPSRTSSSPESTT